MSRGDAVTATTNEPSLPVEVAAAFESFPAHTHQPLMAMRRLIFATADQTDGVGAIEETLKWGQPAYVTIETAAGSTVRLSAARPDSGFDYAVHFICHTTLVESFRKLFPKTLTFDQNRSILLRADEKLPEDELRECIAMALTYHL
ncbi:MAG: DUF1801 domain-containing protein [Acidimicrobiia bacterium]|nr:DUF1801 domain-containing protein [Acidimicrobiia bacterium]